MESSPLRGRLDLCADLGLGCVAGRLRVRPTRLVSACLGGVRATNQWIAPRPLSPPLEGVRARWEAASAWRALGDDPPSGIRRASARSFPMSSCVCVRVCVCACVCVRVRVCVCACVGVFD